MNIKFISNLALDIFIKKEVIDNIDFKDKTVLENYLKKLFKTLKDKYNIEITGFYEVIVYIDRYYGVILHLQKEDLDYYEYFKNQVDMKIIIMDTEVLYQVEDIPNCLTDKVKVCIRDNNIYLKIKQDLTKLEMMKLLEISKLVYDI